MNQLEGNGNDEKSTIDDTQAMNSKGIEQNKGDMQRVRDLLLGDNRDVVTSPVEQDARRIVSEVFSEALFDRQKKDGSVDQVILPIVENSVENSISNHREQFIGYLYPLVGSLVRKSVTAFITEFLEKTNELIENSFTIKGLKWRYRAWRTGVSFSEYAASQTFQFRVKQVLLIHRKTGLLLKSVALDHQLNENADIVSSMLGAINDFVSDTFTSEKVNDEQNLGVVKTENFTLLIKQGPYALLVAAINGNTSPHYNDQLDSTLEHIHRLYLDELVAFEGDDLPFENCEKPLKDCLVSELKPEIEANQKRPWIAIILSLAGLSGMVYYIVLWWLNENLIADIKQTNTPPGIVIRSIQQDGVKGIELHVLRDPQAIPTTEWLQKFDLEQHTLNIHQEYYFSADPVIIQLRAEQVLEKFPLITVAWNGGTLSLSGELSITEYNELQKDLDSILAFKNNFTLDTKGVAIAQEKLNEVANQQQMLFQKALTEIQKAQFDFPVASAELDATQVEKTSQLADDLEDLLLLASINQYSLGIIIIGTADSLGASSANDEISQTRAEYVKSLLIENGIDNREIMAVGIGKIELEQVATTARKVLINVVYHQNTLVHTEQKGN
jgi:outer membrane protein OmpA-like peptidoglycan-associated protein